jgi:molybdenum cofactor biosynthesis protein B
MHRPPHASHPHEPQAGARSLRVHVVTVSTSRTDATDTAGPLLRELVVQYGHAVAGHTLVADDPAAIGAALDTLLADFSVEAVVLTGGTGVSARDCTPGVVRERLDRELPGFGEIFRMLSWQEVGAAAMLSTAVGGIARGRPVFALPGSPNACRLAMEKLILPVLGHLVSEVSKESPLPAKGAAAQKVAPVKPAASKATPAKGAEAGPSVPTKGIGLTASEPEPAPAPGHGDLVSQMVNTAERPPEEDIATGWRAGLRALGGELRRGSFGEIPESVERIAAAMDVLNAATDRATVVLPDGRSYAAFGYPDLVRNGSKVLLVREAEPFAEIVALHRWPVRVGTCVEGDDGIAPSSDLDPGPVSQERTGAPFPGVGSLFAVEGASVYVLQGRKVAQFDGRNVADGWPLASAVGTLLLHWSQR